MTPVATLTSTPAHVDLCELKTIAISQPDLNINAIRAQFPIFKTNPNLTFFDNAATSQKPQAVIDIINEFYERKCTNAGRATYSWATQIGRKVEESRAVVAAFINANLEDVAFTNGSTDSLNLIASSWGLTNLKDGDEILLCMEDHKSAILPWFNTQAILRKFGIEIKIVPFSMHPTGTYDRKSLYEQLSSRTRVIALSHIHHVYGMEMDLAQLMEKIPDEVVVVLDVSQSAGHIPIDTRTLDVDFIAFSGHKMFAANGTGVLWAHPKRRLEMTPIRLGAKSSINLRNDGFDIDHSTLLGLIECGTLNLPGILSFIPAIDFINSISMPRIGEHLSALTRHLCQRLKTIANIEFAPGPGQCNCTKGYGIVSFRLTDIPSGDLGAYLDSEGIFVRTGDHCLASAMKEEYARISLHAYNTIEEIDNFIDVLSAV